MAFGIDDAITIAIGGIKLTETIVEIIKRYRHTKDDIDLGLLIKEIQMTALKRIDDADLALYQFERMLVERGVDIRQPLPDIINATPFWRPFEQHRLSQILKRFHQFSDSIASSIEDIAALVRCAGKTQEMGEAVVTSTKIKDELQAKLLSASSLKEAIDLLRKTLGEQKLALSV
jgi:hypothetical protein